MGSPDQPRDKDGRWSGGLRDSLEAQLRGKGHTPERATELAREIMVNNGTLDPRTEQLTAKGQQREAMGRAARRIDVHARMTGHQPKHVGYKGGKAFLK